MSVPPARRADGLRSRGPKASAIVPPSHLEQRMEYLYGVLGLGLWGDVLATSFMVQLTIAGVTLYLRRDQTHRAVGLHPAVRHFFRLWLWLTTGQGTCEWVAVHRKHHARCETPD